MIRMLIRANNVRKPTKDYPDFVDFWLESLPAIPRVGDLITLEEMVDDETTDTNGNLLSDEVREWLYRFSFSVFFVAWHKDEKGFYVLISCVGE